MMRQSILSLLVVCAGAAGAQSLPVLGADPDLLQAFPAWLVGDHAKARRHFLAAARRGDPLGQYNLAMMLIHGEGGPPSVEQACALLRTAAVRVAVARAELERCKAGSGAIREASATP
jgi:TPR repeat protein